MLKRLELVGFKSFADKTIFEFHPGITAIVGPNGSGKSNIVDAVRWIMGEQSAKSLRGGEMADVIFNGSTSRRGFGLAEVTMTFDNARRQLPLDIDEVQITRRVYRSGEGEYLINQQVCRLRDIKELFLGSGAGNDAYCIIEQGKVDVLLQASTKDRRVIFEEAAGISRFKAKKIETLRKLERVDQNLSRVKDIIEEVEKQHRSVKLQASKAQRYQEYSNRLKEVRLGLGREEYRTLTTRLEADEAALDAMRQELDQRAARAGACEAEAERLEMLLADLEDDLREREGRLAQVGQEIKAQETTLTHEDTLANDLEAELALSRKRGAELAGRVRVLAQAVQGSEHEVQLASGDAQEHRRQVAILESDLQDTVEQLRALQEKVSADKAEHLELMRRAAHVQNDAIATRAHLDNLQRERQRLQLRSDQVNENLASIDLELHELESADQGLHGRLTQARQALHETKERRDRLRQETDELTASAGRLREQRSGLASRVEVLEGLIRTHEGLGAGPREVFRLIEENPAWGGVLGMLADFLTVKREHAHLIDLALGDQAQHFLVRDIDALLTAQAQRPDPLPGRVAFVPIGDARTASPVETLRTNPDIDITVLSRLKQADEALAEPALLVVPAEELISCELAELADLPARLLGTTLIVRDLPTARHVARRAPGFRILTLQGELLDAGGTLTLGSSKAEAGLLSRRSELEDLQEQAIRLDAELVDLDARLGQTRVAMEEERRRIDDQEQEIEVLAEQAGDFRARVQQYRDRRAGLNVEVALQRDEIGRLDQEIGALQTNLSAAQEEAAQAEQKVEELHRRIHDADLQVHRLDQDRQKKAQAATAGQVALAKVEERLAGIRSRHDQAARDLAQRQQELDGGRSALFSCQQRLSECQQNMLRASAALALLYLDKETGQRDVADLIQQRETRRQDRVRLAQQAQSVRSEWRTQQETFHQRELAATELRHQRQTLLERIREDYQVDLADWSVTATSSATPFSGEPKADADSEPATLPSASLEPPPATLDLAAAQQEIEELRKKLSRLGAVNLEALSELNELESRATSLKAQYDDLVSAKKSLEEIISKINQDSRRLFVESLAIIRTHFQELFRKLFGGGMADIILEDEADVLESGIEINARPPGKELRSISLMSGGEKTLTAVALLLAIFRSKPSPFCLLDEVDAALDEANIGRFTTVLRDFLNLSQFIIVTHSKTTMAIADVLYGITMQESGISKQVAIRFEDWVDEGQQPAAQTA